MRRRNEKQEDLETMVNTAHQPKVLTIDIETSPIVAYTWGPKYESNIIAFKEHGQIICYSAKWLHGKQITKALDDYSGYRSGKVNDEKIVADIHQLLDEADIVVTQNGIDFDLKYINARFIKHGLQPPSPYKSVDTKREVKKIARLASNSLDDISEYFGIGRKIEHRGISLWFDCIAGDKKAWKEMKKYNAQDVVLTEKVYELLLPYMKNHPNIGSYVERPICGRCGGAELQSRGQYRTLSNVYQRFQCTSCGGWSRAQKRERGITTSPGV